MRKDAFCRDLFGSVSVSERRLVARFGVTSAGQPPRVSASESGAMGVSAHGTVSPSRRLRRPAIRAWSSDGWVAFISRRLVGVGLVALFLAFATFFMVRLLPGDPALYIAGSSGSDVTPERLNEIRQETGIDQPFLTQLEHYVGNVFTGHFGRSFATNESVGAILLRNALPSIELAALAVAFVMIVSIVGGFGVAHFTRDRRRPRTEVAFTTITSVLGAIPDFLIGTVLVYVFAVQMHVLPVGDDDGFTGIILPALALAIPPTAMLMRIVRVETLNALAQDYVRTARSKRLPTRHIYLRHILPNVLTSAMTIGGVLFAALLGGTVVIETLFARPGLGSTLVSAVLSRDYPYIQAVFLVLGVVVALVNLTIDVVLGVIDPRTRSVVQ